ncbi:hypothetical protein F3Y22_tig00111779pilonHSYRG00295 [Hibiscus syriacus]|uniref:2Fe-2S ferredoxin-type domain-containing protein n=1 Tax=Hibiscus syriacus TaxID=106335 RepID=A0A6A2XUS1_HIBSY|nr:ferredoxin, root R-B1-like [Hibiscus syriacus]KAE8673660.1 hypothetical protein F3Y22_tig00111779pilonHSYRG00295 [Hibiscus syriacus]
MTTTKIISHCLVRASIPNRFFSAIVTVPTSLGFANNVSKPVGLKCSSKHRTPMAAYKIKLVGLDGVMDEFEAPRDEYILDAAENAEVALLHDCRAGICAACVGKIVSGSMDQPDATLLDEKQIANGYLLA